MVKQKLFSLLLLIGFLTSLSLIPMVSASTVLSYSFGNTYGQACDNENYYGQKFNATIDADLEYSIFYIYKASGATGTLISKLYNTTAGGLPDVELAESTDGISIADLGTSTSGTQVTFHFPASTEISLGTSYVISLEPNSTCTGYWYMRASSAASTMKCDVPNWSSVGTAKMWYLFMGESTSPTPTPTPTPTATPTSPPGTPMPDEYVEVWEIVGNLITLITPLLVVLIPAFLGYKLAGAWGFLAGINVGAILSYVMLGDDIFPLWGIVAILILDALLLFGKVGFRE